MLSPLFQTALQTLTIVGVVLPSLGLFLMFSRLIFFQVSQLRTQSPKTVSYSMHALPCTLLVSYIK